MTNALMVIEPYWHLDTWVFDDRSVGLEKEPFVAGIPQMIDDLVKGIPNARSGFRLVFSAAPFPEYRRRITRVREDSGGNWYRIDGGSEEGWLCPALLKYFETAPEAIYVNAEPRRSSGAGDTDEVTALRNRVDELERLVYSLTMEIELLKAANLPPPQDFAPPNSYDVMDPGWS